MGHGDGVGWVWVMVRVWVMVVVCDGCELWWWRTGVGIMTCGCLRGARIARCSKANLATWSVIFDIYYLLHYIIKEKWQSFLAFTKLRQEIYGKTAKFGTTWQLCAEQVRV